MTAVHHALQQAVELFTPYIYDAYKGDPSLEEAILALTDDHIVEGNLIWYSGFTSGGPWSCPAELVNVNPSKRTFQVRSLDDMKLQDPVYTFSPKKSSPTSRLTMRAIEKDIAAAYVSWATPTDDDKREIYQKHAARLGLL